MMGLRYLVTEHVGKGMMVQMLQDGILKLNHCCLMSCLKGGKYTHARGSRKLHVVCGVHPKVSRRKGC
jgi:hypothetical protein